MNAYTLQKVFLGIGTAASIGATVVSAYETFRPAPPGMKRGIEALTFLGSLGGSAVGLYLLFRTPSSTPSAPRT